MNSYSTDRNINEEVIRETKESGLPVVLVGNKDSAYKVAIMLGIEYIEFYPKPELDKKEQEKLNAEKADERAHKPVQTNDNFKNKDQKRAEAAFRKTLSPLKKEIEKLEHSLDELNARKNELETILADASIYEAARKNELQAYLLEQSSVSEKLEEVETEWMLKSEELQDKITAFENEQA